MIRNILVPLDGSSLAEAALPGALWFAGLFKAQITLLHVIEHHAPASVHGDRHLTQKAEALEYLRGVASAFPPGLHTELHVHSEEVSDVPRSIAMHAGELMQDLVVMCSHGRSGLRQFMVGSNAQQVIGLGSVPVLLIQPQRDQKTQFENPKSFLVALDDDPEHVCGLELAGQVAARSGIALLLLNVVPRLESLRGEEAAAGKLLPSATIALLDMEEEEARRLLISQAQPWIDRGIDITVQIQRGDPAEQIANTTASSGASVIVLGTHGKRGIDAFWAGSVAPRLPHLTDQPLLLVPTCRTYSD